MTQEKRAFHAWVTLSPSEKSPTTYILTTTKYIDHYIGITEFEVDMETRTSKKIEENE